MRNFFSKLGLIAVFTATNAMNLTPTQSEVQSKGIISLDYVPKKELMEAQEKAIKDETFSEGQEFGKIINDLAVIPYSNMDAKTEYKGLESLDSVQKKELKETQEAAIKDETFLNGQEFGKIINDWKATRYSNMGAKTESKGPVYSHSASKELVPNNINTLMTKNKGIKGKTFLNRKEFQKKIKYADKATRHLSPTQSKVQSKGLESLHSVPNGLGPNYIDTLMTKNIFGQEAGIEGETLLNPKEIRKMIHNEAMAAKRFKPKQIRKTRKLKK